MSQDNQHCVLSSSQTCRIAPGPSKGQVLGIAPTFSHGRLRYAFFRMEAMDSPTALGVLVPVWVLGDTWTDSDNSGQLIAGHASSGCSFPYIDGFRRSRQIVGLGEQQRRLARTSRQKLCARQSQKGSQLCSGMVGSEPPVFAGRCRRDLGDGCKCLWSAGGWHQLLASNEPREVDGPIRGYFAWRLAYPRAGFRGRAVELGPQRQWPVG